MSDQDKFAVIIDQVCKYLKMQFDEVQQPKRNRELCEARQYIFHYGKKHTKLPYAYMGSFFEGANPGGKDRTTVLHGINTIDNLKNQQPYRRTLASLDHYISQALASAPQALIQKEIVDTAVSMGSY